MSERVSERGAVFIRSPTDIRVAKWQWQRLLIKRPVPPGPVTQPQLKKQALLYLSLAGRKSSSNGQVSVISLTWRCLFLIYNTWGNGSYATCLVFNVQMRACHIVRRALLHSPTYMHCTYAHMHACAQLHGLCEHSGTSLHVNYGHKLWTVGKYVFVFLLCRQRLWDGNYLAGIQEPISI